MEYRIIYNDELYHHGVKGMKWGVRNDKRASGARAKAALGRTASVARSMAKTYNDSVNRGSGGITNKPTGVPKDAKGGPKKSEIPKGAMSERSGRVDLRTKATSKSFKVNEASERAKSAVASKLGMKKTAQKHKNNAEYYKKTSDDLASGKVGKPKTNYQKAMRWLGKTNFATHAIKNSKDLSPQMKAQALAEQRLMRSADGWYKKRAKQFAAVKAIDIAIAVGKRG